MVVNYFLKWIGTASVSQRAAAAAALARAYLSSNLTFEDRCAAEAALTLLLDDPSAKVRLALAETFSLSHHAPLQIISALAADQPEIASLVLARSPLFTDHDLIDRIASGNGNVQRAIAGRPRVSMAVAAALAELGDKAACLALLRNDGAEIASLSFRRIAERHGAEAKLREAMFGDRRLPADARHLLLLKLGETLKDSPLVVGLIGADRANRVTREACIKASLTLIDGTRPEEYAALVEHMRLRGDLTTGFLVRAVANGKIDFFGAVLIALSGYEAARIRALLAGGRESSLAALFRAAGIAEGAHGLMITALKIWREVANGRRIAGVQEVTWLMLKKINAAPGQTGPAGEHADLAALVRSIHVEALRANARSHARAITAA